MPFHNERMYTYIKIVLIFSFVWVVWVKCRQKTRQHENLLTKKIRGFSKKDLTLRLDFTMPK
jgi:hypothetical protein